MTTIDWRKELDLAKRIWKWWLGMAFLAIPFGLIYACTVRVVGYDSKLALGLCIVGVLACNYLIQGIPPDK